MNLEFGKTVQQPNGYFFKLFGRSLTIGHSVLQMSMIILQEYMLARLASLVLLCMHIYIYGIRRVNPSCAEALSSKAQERKDF